MNISGYAYSAGAGKVSAERIEASKLLKERCKDIEITSRHHAFNRNICKGKILAGSFTELEIALICHGSMPFGGLCEIHGQTFTCTEYTD